MASRATPSLRSSTSGKPVTTPAPSPAGWAGGGAKAGRLREDRSTTGNPIPHPSPQQDWHQSGRRPMATAGPRVPPDQGRAAHLSVAVLAIGVVRPLHLLWS